MTNKIIQKIFFLALICISLETHSKEFICKANSPLTEIFFLGDIFKLNVNDKCINLSKLSGKSDNWSWKVVQGNSLGDFDAVRNFCDGKDLGLVGQSAHWDETKKVFTTFTIGKPFRVDSFTCYENK